MLPVFDVLCKRVLSFISKCVNCDCDLVSFCARHAILYGCVSSPVGRSAVYCGLRYMFDIGCLLSPKFNHSNVEWNYYLSTISSEQLAKVDILKDMLLFRDNPSRCIGLFVNDKISTAINCICTE